MTRGSVHERIWQSQREFRLDVLAEMLSTNPRQSFKTAEGEALGAIAQADLTTVKGRIAAAQSAVRLLQNRWAEDTPFNGFATHQEEIAFATRNRLWAVNHDDEATEAVAKLIIELREQTTTLYVELIKDLMAVLQLRMRSPAPDIRLLAIFCNALDAGLVTDPLPIAKVILDLPTGPNGEMEPWHPSSIGLWAIIRGMIEIDDDTLSETERRL